jgi:hypothetical protein
MADRELHGLSARILSKKVDVGYHLHVFADTSAEFGLKTVW